MASGKFIRQFHNMTTPEMPSREGQTFVFGRCAPRRAGAGFILCPSDFVSRRHCEVYFRNGSFWINDLGSLNGTYLNGDKLMGERELQFGNRVGLGIAENSPDFEPQDVNLFIFIFQRYEVEVIDLFDDEDLNSTELVPSSTLACAPPPPAQNTPPENSPQDAEEITPSEAVSNVVQPSPIPISPKNDAEVRIKPLPAAPPPPIIRPVENNIAVAPEPKSSTENSTQQSSKDDRKPKPGPASVQRDREKKRKASLDLFGDGIPPAKKPSTSESLEKPRISVESNSADDSSDGMSDTYQKSKQSTNSLLTMRPKETPRNKPDSSSGKCRSSTYSVATTNATNPKPSSHKIKKAVIKLRQLIRVAGGIPTIRKSKYIQLSLRNREKIQQQWNSSMQRSSVQSYIRNRVSDSDSSDSSDMMVPIIKKKKSKQPTLTETKQKPKLLEGEKVSSITCRDSTDSDGREEPQEKLSRSHERLNSDEAEQNKIESPQHAGYSQPYGSPDRYPSPISDEEIREGEVVISKNIFSDEEDEPDFDESNQREELLDEPPHHELQQSTKTKTPSPSHGKNQRQAILIDTPPTPRSARKAQERVKNNTFDEGIKYPVSTKANKDKDPQAALTLREKLKLITPQKSITEAEPAPDVPKPNAPVKTKSSKSRNADFMETLMATGSAEKDKEKRKSDEPVPMEPSRGIELTRGPIRGNSIESSGSIPAPRREIPPMPSPETQAKMPIFTILKNSMPKPSDKIAMPPPMRPIKLKPLINPMEKNGVQNALERQAKSNVYEYRHKLPLEKPSGRRDIDKFEPTFPEDEAHKRILKWRPAWLEEQKLEKNNKFPPPVAEGFSVVRTLTEYVDYKSYITTFFPLMLLEIWATVTQDKAKRRSSRGQVTEFSLAIERVHKTDLCPMLGKKGKEPNQDQRDRYYTILDCYTYVNSPTQIDQRMDFAILTLNIIHHNTKGEIVSSRREFFGNVLFTHSTSLIDNASVNFKLKETNPSATYKYTFQVVIHTKEKLDTKYIGKIQKISYISPKLREFRAIFHLKNSKLFEKIIHPRPSSLVWNPNAVISHHLVVQYVSKLNPVQKSAVAYVADRVKNSEPELLLLHGPPGTGKTRTIVGMILQILLSKDQPNQDNKILVCTPSNTAIDEIMLRLEEAIKDLPTTSGNNKIVMVRMGETEGSEMKKYSIDSYLRQREDKNSMNASIKKSIDMARKEQEAKVAEITALKKVHGSRTRIESLKRDLEEIKTKLKDFEADLSRTKSERAPFSTREKQQVLQAANVICSTLNSCTNSILTQTFGPNSRKSKPFTCCIVDEASQTTEPESLAPLLLQIDKLILVGDPHQLGATVLSQEAETKAYSQSLFSRLNHFYTQILEKPQSIIMLTQQYRMHPEILNWPNEFFYKGLLKTQCIGRSADDACPIKPYLFLNLSSQETSNREGQISNDEESKTVVGILKYFKFVFDSEERNWSIGVITPYSTQKATITQEIEREKELNKHKNCLPESIEVDTVDSFQGREKDIVIISCVRTDDTGFLKNAKRLNVALTRARHSLLILGDAECLKKDSMWKSLIDNANERKCLQNISRKDCKNPGFLKKRLHDVLSPVKSQIPDHQRKRDQI